MLMCIVHHCEHASNALTASRTSALISV